MVPMGVCINNSDSSIQCIGTEQLSKWMKGDGSLVSTVGLRIYICTKGEDWNNPCGNGGRVTEISKKLCLLLM